uniref:Uncharacterized protein n=1 Tax=Tetranychus urticae TaxID=32264 RepID=A0A158P4C9_TETUR
MEYLHPSSLPASKSELSLFTVPPTQVAIDSSYEVEYRPSASLESSKVHTIDVPASEDFTDLSQTMVHINLEVHDKDGKKVKTADIKGVENFGNALFDQVDFFIGTVNTSQATNMYHYQSYIENLLFRHPTKADAGRYDTSNFLKNNVDLYFRLHLPMCQQDKLLLNGIPLLFRFTRSREKFPLIHITQDEYTIKITKLALHIKRVKLFPDTQTGIISALKESPAKYFIIRNVVKSFSMNKGVSTVNIENIFSGILPRRVIVGFVDETAFAGNNYKDPYWFEHANITQISLNVDGNLYPSIPYQPSFPDNCMREYVNLFRCLGQDEGIPQLDLDYENYKSKKTLFGFDLGGGLGGETGSLSLIKRGAVRLELRFAAETTSSYKIIVFGQFDNLITIDKDRIVTLDY